MPADPSIYGLLQPPANPLDSYGKALNLRALMTQNRVHELQAQDTEQTINEKNAFREGLKGIAPGELEAAIPRLMSVAPTQALALQQQLLQQRQLTGSIKHTEAQTGEITAGHIAGAWAALAKGGGSDEAVKAAHDMMLPLVGEERANQVTQTLLAQPPETRLAYAVAQAGQHKTGQEALKLFFPDAEIKDNGSQLIPVSRSTLPGSPAPGTPIPGGVPIQKTQSPDSVASQQTAREGHAITARGQNMVDARQREMNGIYAGSVVKPSDELIDALGKGDIELRPPPMNARNPIMMQRYDETLARVKTKYPDFAQEQYPTIKKTVASFSSGPDSKTIQALSNATGHLDTYEKLALAMKNGDSQAVNAIVNKVRTAFGSDAPTNPQAVSHFLAAEIVKAASGTGGGVADREKMEASFANKSSPDQMVGAANTVREIMGQQFRTLDQKYKAGTYGRRGDFASTYLTLPEVRAAYDRAVNAHAEQKPETAPAGGLVATIKTDADFDKLKSGAEFIGPDGKRRRKP